MSRLESNVLKKLGDSWEAATPGFCVQAFLKGKKIVDIEVGETYRYYDLASLTKLFFTTTNFMFLVQEKHVRLTDPISKWVDWFPATYEATLKDLFTHSAGMTWWYPFYEKVNKKTTAKTSPEDAWDIFEGIFKRQVLADLKKKPVKKIEKSVYSDVDFFLLGFIMESVTGKTLYNAWTDLADRMGFDETNFNRGNKPIYAKKLYAPTEIDKNRGGTLRGAVHDDNTWALKGVAPHAGLFAPIEDLSRWGLLLRGGIRGARSNSFPKPEIVRRFTHRAIPASRGDWATGFMMPSKGTASCGPLFSPQSVGHTGFTGTSVWYDPKKDLLITILSNRVHPTRENALYLKLRPQIHTLIAEDL